MFYKILIILFFLFSCSPNTLEVNNINNKVHHIYSNTGFTLIYNDDLKKQKIISKSMNDRSFLIFQKNLKKNKTVKVTNLINNKSVIAIVGSNSKYPSFYNSVITKRIANSIELNSNEPYVEITEIINSSSFVAKKAKTFDEEKQVAGKAPVDSISVNDLNSNKKKIKNFNKEKFSYIIKIADFYFKDSAKFMIERIKEETTIKNINLKSISDTNYRVFLGPFNNLNSLKRSFNDISLLEFENMEIIKND